MKRFLACLLIVSAFIMNGCKSENTTNRIYMFSQPGCIHCEHAREYMQRYYKNYDIKELNIHEGNNMGYLLSYARKFKVPEQTLGTPFIVMGKQYIMGWGNQQVKDFNRYAKAFRPQSQTAPKEK